MVEYEFIASKKMLKDFSSSFTKLPEYKKVFRVFLVLMIMVGVLSLIGSDNDASFVELILAVLPIGILFFVFLFLYINISTSHYLTQYGPFDAKVKVKLSAKKLETSSTLSKSTVELSKLKHYIVINDFVFMMVKHHKAYLILPLPETKKQREQFISTLDKALPQK